MDENNEKKSANNTVKKAAKKWRVILLLAKMLIPLMLILALTLSVFSIFDKLGDAWQTVLSIFDTKDLTAANKIVGLPGSVVQITDIEVQTFIDSITNLGIDLADLKLLGDVDYSNPDVQERNEQALKKYIKKFYEVQAMTETIHIDPTWIDDLTEPVLWGTITGKKKYLYNIEDTADEDDTTLEEAISERTGNSKNQGKKLKQTTYKNLKQLVEQNDSKALNFFAVVKENDKDIEENEVGDLILAYRDKETQNYYLKTIKREGGRVFIRDTNGQELQYKTYAEMQEMASNKNSNVLNCFAIDEDTKNLILAYKVVTTTTVDGKTSTETNYYLKTITYQEYKQILSQYTTPVTFLLYLELITQNPEFVSAIVDLAKESEIRLTVMRDTNISTNTTTSTYTAHTEGLRDDGTAVPESTQEGQTETVTTRTETQTAKIGVTYVKTWFSEETVTYNQSDSGEQTGPSSTETIDETEKVSEMIGNKTETTWRTDVNASTTSSSQTIKYEKGVSTGVKYIGGEQGSQGIIDKNKNNKVDNDEKVDSNSTFVGLLDNRFKIPNSDRYEAPGTNLVSGAEMLFYLMQKDYRLQNLELIMRYMLYMYTGRSYGVTELDLSIFATRDFRIVVGGSSELLTEYIHYFEHSTQPPTNADGTKYIIEDDGVGNPVVGYGVDIFNGGFATLFEQAGYPTNIGGEVDKDFVDSLEKQEIQSVLEAVTNATTGLDLKEYQIHALVSRAYNCGTDGAVLVKRGSPSLNFVDSYRQYWNSATDDLYEKGSTSGNLHHNLYIQYMSKPVTARNKKTGEIETLPGLVTRRKSEWTLFQTGYYDVLGTRYSMGMEGSTNVSGTEFATYQSSSGRNYIQYKQNRGPWAQAGYGDNTIAYQGCSITSLAIALSGYGYDFTPIKWSSSSLISMSGQIATYASNSKYVPIGSESYAIPATSTYNKTEIIEHLRTGNAVIIHVLGSGRGYRNTYTSNQHWMVLLDVKEDGSQVYVSNPYDGKATGWENIDTVLTSLCCYILVQE